ncbi:hypothetical protein A8F94_08310 [Bacillus sp. FJAT-27225]|uniref:hypothetical protein n=1 Tax=Bacillus sp. FJAT-27225 TaxID=1743144 RepID=UPI00080C3572|nr:hypothetical protein [Bacillus sp. FJAT-27225]OCA87834.1 hypothetical protein A8F94_08310 [Bacillus sp. FJAT-27225]
MSVSLALIPLALTLRVVMGKDKFNNWVESAQLKVPTTFENELDLVRTVRMAGYDAEKWGGSIKTHLDGEKQFFFWELVEGKWHAIFSKHDPMPLLEGFMKDLELKSNRKLFVTAIKDIEAQVTEDAVKVFPTNFVDGDLLTKTLREFGVNPYRKDNGEIVCTVQGTPMTFRQTSADTPFTVELRNPPDMHEVFMYMSDIDEEYKRCLQSAVYEKLKQRAAAKNLSVESEEVLDDNSIVITLNIQG